jgi:Zn-dependent protease with chaperone function
LSGVGEEFNDGKTAARHRVAVRLDAVGLHLTSSDGTVERHWPFEKLRVVEAPRPGTPLRLTCETDADARLRLSDPVNISALRQQAPQLFQSGLARPNVRRNAAIIVLVLALLALFLWQGLPRLSAPLARLIPLAWEQDIGLAFRTRLLAGAKICDGGAGAAVLSRLTGRLSAGLASAPALTVVVADLGMVNAFALPGGHIVIFRGLLAKTASADEVAAVLAHEIGHVAQRHPTQMALRVMGIGMLADLLTGDGSTLTELASEIGGTLLLLSYSRDMERQADEFGQDLLRRAHLSTYAMADFYARLRGARKTAETNSLTDYFSSHPPLGERIAATVKDDAGQPALDAEAWRALRNICG